MNNKTKQIAFLGLCVALSLVLSYVEVLLPPLFPAVPGIKIGLANIVTVFLLYRSGEASAIGATFVRIILVSILFGTVTSFLYSLAGGFFSLVTMILLKKTNAFSELGVSVSGGVMHNVGQILTAMLLLETAELGYYLVVLIVTGTVAGLFVGILGAILNKRLPKIYCKG